MYWTFFEQNILYFLHLWEENIKEIIIRLCHKMLNIFCFLSHGNKPDECFLINYLFIYLLQQITIKMFKDTGHSPSPPLVLSAYVSALLTAPEHHRSLVPFWNLPPNKHNWGRNLMTSQGQSISSNTHSTAEDFNLGDSVFFLSQVDAASWRVRHSDVLPL